jgi:uncharacterized protein (DUF1778 family)
MPDKSSYPARRTVPSEAKGAARRNRVQGGRPHSIKVRLTTEERAILVASAAEAQLSVQRFLLESAHPSRKPMKPATRPNTALMEELASIRRLVSNLANNMNQIARRLNAGGRPDGRIPPVIDAAGRAISRLDRALAASAVPYESDPSKWATARYRAPLPRTGGT